MSEDLAAQIKHLAVLNSLHRSGAGTDLADSASFLRRLDGLSPSAPDFDAKVAAAVREHAGPSPQELAAEQAARAERERKRAAGEAAEAAARRRQPGYQWSQADVDAAGPDELTAAYERNQLAAIGMAAKPRPQRREVARPVLPSPQQEQRWRRMPPWAARRARAEWARSAGGAA